MGVQIPSFSSPKAKKLAGEGCESGSLSMVPSNADECPPTVLLLSTNCLPGCKVGTNSSHFTWVNGSTDQVNDVFRVTHNWCEKLTPELLCLAPSHTFPLE